MRTRGHSGLPVGAAPETRTSSLRHRPREDHHMNAPLDALAQHAQQFGDRTAVIVDASGGARASTTTFAEVNQLVNRLAHGLLAEGARPGERLVWCGPNSLEVLVTIHAARKLNLVAVPLSYRFNAEEMAYVIDNSDATTVVVDADEAPLVAEVRARIPKVRTVDRVRRSRARRLPELGRRDRRPTRLRARRRGGQRSGRGDDLHVGHHGQAQRRAAHPYRPADRVLAAGRAEPPARERGAPHDRPALPLGPARVRLPVAHARRADRRAAQVRRRSVARSRRRPIGSRTPSPRPRS